MKFSVRHNFKMGNLNLELFSQLYNSSVPIKYLLLFSSTCCMSSSSNIIVINVFLTANIIIFIDCYKPLGMIDGRIHNSQIIASSTKGTAYPYLARLHNRPERGEKIKFWQPQDGPRSYLQINLGKETKISAIATQGHFDANVKEFATSYYIEYRIHTSSWRKTKVNSLNRDFLYSEMFLSQGKKQTKQTK